MRQAAMNSKGPQMQFERLPDPCNDRVVKSVPLPPLRPLSITQLFPQYISFGEIAPPSLPTLRECLILDGRVDKKALLKLVKQCTQVLSKEQNLVEQSGEVVIIGDIHG